MRFLLYLESRNPHTQKPRKLDLKTQGILFKLSFFTWPIKHPVPVVQRLLVVWGLLEGGGPGEDGDLVAHVLLLGVVLAAHGASRQNIARRHDSKIQLLSPKIWMPNIVELCNKK